MPVGNSKKLKIAFFNSMPANVGSGCERLIYETARGLIARGNDARVYLMNARMDPRQPFFVHAIPTVPLEISTERKLASMTGWNDFFFPSTGLFRLRSWIGGADIWHFHNLHGHFVSIPLLGLGSWTKRIVISPVDEFLSTGYCAYPMDCRRHHAGCGSCQRIGDPWPGISKDKTAFLLKIKRLFFRFSRVNMLFHTEALANVYRMTFVGRKPATVIRYGVDIDCFRPLSKEMCARDLRVRRSDRFVAGFFHSNILDKRKGLVSLLAELRAYTNDLAGKVDILVVGHGSDQARDMVPSELGVIALPYLSRSRDLANALNLCDVLMYPTHAENLSLLSLSALACGVPVISYDAGGQKEAIIDGVNGFIVGQRNVQDMVGRLLQMVGNPSLCRQLSEGARKIAEERFDFDRYVDHLVRYYRKIVGRQEAQDTEGIRHNWKAGNACS